MALTQVSTNGIKDATIATADIADDAVTAAKVADNAVVTAAINDDAVTSAKLAASSVGADALDSGAVVTANIAADAVTGAKIADDAVGSEHIEILDATLQFGDSVNAEFGASGDLKVFHDGSNSYIKDTGSGALKIASDQVQILSADLSESMILCDQNEAVGLYYNGVKTFQTASSGNCHLLGDTDVRLTLGSQGTEGTNDANWIRGEGVNLMFNSASGNHTWEVGGSEKLRLQSGGGISFNGDNQAANALDDYEEGVWTPAVTFGGGNTGQNYDGNTGGAYTKIGRMVHIHGRIEFTDKGSSSGNAVITGLPFAAANVTSGNSSLEGGCYFTYESNFMSSEDRASVLAYITQGNSTIKLYFRNDSGDINQISNSDFENATNLAFEGIYPAA